MTKPFQPIALQEKRLAARVPFSASIQYLAGEGVQSWKPAEAVDLSETGLRIKFWNPALLEGQSIETTFKFRGEKYVILKGKVLWTHPVLQGFPSFECGILLNAPLSSTHPELFSILPGKMSESLAVGESKALEVRLAQNIEEMKSAFSLVYDEYRKRGYCMESPSRMHYTCFSFLPNSRLFILKEKGNLIGTVSLIPDSPCGLPMESVFPSVVQRFRKPSRKISEVGLLALHTDAFQKGSFSLANFRKLKAAFYLFKTMFDYARGAAGITDFLIAVHPKHEKLYRTLQFQVLGPAVESYPGACSKPALPMHFDVLKVVKTVSSHHGVGSYFLNHFHPDENTQTHFSWTRTEMGKFLKDYLPLWDKITPQYREFLERCYSQ